MGFFVGFFGSFFAGFFGVVFFAAFLEGAFRVAAGLAAFFDAFFCAFFTGFFGAVLASGLAGDFFKASATELIAVLTVPATSSAMARPNPTFSAARSTNALSAIFLPSQAWYAVTNRKGSGGLASKCAGWGTTRVPGGAVARVGRRRGRGEGEIAVNSRCRYARTA